MLDDTPKVGSVNAQPLRQHNPNRIATALVNADSSLVLDIFPYRPIYIWKKTRKTRYILSYQCGHTKHFQQQMPDTHPLMHPLLYILFTHSDPHPSIHIHIHALLHPFIHPFIHVLINSCTYSPTNNSSRNPLPSRICPWPHPTEMPFFHSLAQDHGRPN